MSSSFLERCATAEKWLARISDVTGRSVAWLTLAMMLVTCCVVVLRYALNAGSVALQESVTYMHGVVFLLGIAYTLNEGGHVRVDILYVKTSARVQAIIDLAGTLLFLFPVMGFIGWISIGYVAFSWRLGEASAEPGGLPGVYLLKTLIPLMALSVIAQGAAEVLRNIRLIHASGSDGG